LFRRQTWGTGTQIKQELLKRDQQIYKDYLAGSKVSELACKYYLSKKSIQRILRKMKE
jgi:Mor family transcriptional regulator